VVGVGRWVGDAKHEEIVFEHGDSVQAPGGVGQGLDEMDFGGAFGMVFVGERFYVELVDFEVFVGMTMSWLVSP